MRLTIEERAANGARWLDENFPGWEKRINIKTLNLENGEACICGQVFKRKARNWGMSDGYDYASETLFAEANSWISGMVPKGITGWYRARKVSAVLGFSLPGNLSSKASWQKLQDAWVKLLEERVNVKVPA